MHLYQRLAAPDIDAFTQLAHAAYLRLPPEFRQAVGSVVFRVQDFADEETLAEMGIEDPFELSGLYHGVDLSRRSVLDPAPAQSEVYLYRRPILDEWAERGDVELGALIEHVLIHEIAHHLGLSDDDIHAIEDALD
ncbi:MAG: metallopeptidase family protein [Caulobacteraceae bacterium]|nr:metallopeptidase family protein [Caulobacteraceae bacterium]